MLVGATADELAQPTLAASQQEADRAAKAGLRAARMTLTWTLGETAPTASDLVGLRNGVDAVSALGIRVLLSIYPEGSRQTPLDDPSRSAFAQFAAATARALPEVHDVLVGNEPNLNRFWLPQFNDDGSDAAAPAYVQLLATTYDALKAVSPAIVV